MAFPLDFPQTVVVVGIGTDVGKTVASSVLCLGLKANYWKPVQAGLLPETDTQFVRRATGLPDDHFLPEAYCLRIPASPHHSAALEGVAIRPDKIRIPASQRPLIIEGAGGLMVPLNPDTLYIDLIAAWSLPVVLVVKTYLGSINHSLLSLEALRSRGIALAGIIFNDGGYPESEAAILKYADSPLLGMLPELSPIHATTLAAVFDDWCR